MTLNARSHRALAPLTAEPESRRIQISSIDGGGRLIDCGISSRGGYHAGLDLARLCMADLASVEITMSELEGVPLAEIRVATDAPIAACLASQYAGWQLAEGKFFAMGSGPMRAAAGREPIFDKIGHRERADSVLGILEGRKLPGPDVFAKIAEACGVAPAEVTLLIAPTASLAGGVQIVARSVETALHKLADLDFDLERIVSGVGSAPLPPVAKHDLAAIGRTNDAILYGASVILAVTGDDDSLAEIGPKVPSSASPDHGEPFATIFERYNHDFYKVDPHLFSPARIVFQNLQTGRTHAFGRLEPTLLARSFFGN